MARCIAIFNNLWIKSTVTAEKVKKQSERFKKKATTFLKSTSTFKKAQSLKTDKTYNLDYFIKTKTSKISHEYETKMTFKQ
jgi:hypothetical protein